jgi:enterochelin esterase family protein
VKRIGILAALALLILVDARAQGFSDFVHMVANAREADREALVDSFLLAHPVLPLIENDTLAIFLWKGTAASVSIAGDMTQWSPVGLELQRLSTTSLWHRSAAFEADARLDYKIVADEQWMLDPRNPRTCTGGFGANSELRMPACAAQPERSLDAALPRGSFFDTTMAGFGLDGRAVRVYLPAGYDASSPPCPVLLVHDGPDYLMLGGMDAVLDQLIARRRIPPTIAVFVPAVNRSSEYAGAKMQRYGDWLADTLLPWVETRFRTRRDAGGHATMGASDGGNIALQLGFAHPDAFGCIGAQSGNVVASIASAAQNGPKLALRVYLEIGTYDIPLLRSRVGGLRQSLEAKGYELLYSEPHEGHSWGNWRARIDDALLFFFGSDSTAPGSRQPSSGATPAR